MALGLFPVLFCKYLFTYECDDYKVIIEWQLATNVMTTAVQLVAWSSVSSFRVTISPYSQRLLDSGSNSKKGVPAQPLGIILDTRTKEGISLQVVFPQLGLCQPTTHFQAPVLSNVSLARISVE